MDWVPFGKLGKSHGLKGEVKFYPCLPDLEFCQGISRVRIENTGGSWVECEVEKIRGHHPPFIVKLKSCRNIDEAKTLRNREVQAPRSEFPDLNEGDYYWFDIEGLEVYDESGKFYGKVEEVLQTGANDVYVVRGEGGEILLPAIDWVIREIDLDNGRLVFSVVDGLLESNAV